jgi:uncharacterized protein YprB with RNaseH-like and TPR domain
MMLRSSFVMLRGVGRATEKKIRLLGIQDWDGFRARPELPGIGLARKSAMDSHLAALEKCLARGDARVFWEALPALERWRLYPDFREHAAFLDIETTGLDIGSDVTVVGIFLEGSFTPFIRGVNLSERALARALRPARILVTFNGASFDLPMLRVSFPSLPLDIPHIDLRHLAPRAGIRGGLKKVERLLGIGRAEQIKILCSHDAVHLWRIWERKRSANALRLLVDYNRADCENLRRVADEVCRRMAKKLSIPPVP